MRSALDVHAAAPFPAPAAFELPLLPLLVALSLLGAGLGWYAHRSGVASLASALLRGSLPAALWVLVATLNPARPTRLSLTPFGSAVAVSFLCGGLATRSAAARAHASRDRCMACYLCSCIGALLGARSVAALDHWAGSPQGPALLGGSLSMNGALLGGVAVSWCCFRREPLRFRAWLDGLAPALGLALALSALAAYLQHPTRSTLCASVSGLLLSVASTCLGAWQRFHGQGIVLVALGYGIVQLSIGAAHASAARPASGLAFPVASWLVLGLAAVAGWVWHKGFTLRRI